MYFNKFFILVDFEVFARINFLEPKLFAIQSFITFLWFFIFVFFEF